MRCLIVGLWCGVMATGMCRGDEEKAKMVLGPEPVLVTAWAEKLSAKYFEGGDRVLVYEATKPGKPAMRFRMADCQSKDVAAVQMGPEGQAGQAMGWFSPAEGEPKCLFAWQGNGEVMQVAGFDVLMKQLGEVGKLMGGEGEIKIGGLDWTLFLTDEALIFRIGTNMEGDGRRAPWLKRELLVKAVDVEVGEKEVVFVLPGNGKVVVRNDGVLLRQEYPVDGVARALGLVSEEKMEEWSVEEHFAKYDPAKVRVEQVDGMRQGMNLMQQFWLGIIRKLAGLETIEDVMDGQRDEMLERLVRLYRPMVKKAMDGNRKPGKMETVSREFLRKSWETYQERAPTKAKEMTYAEFLEEMSKTVMEQLMKNSLEDEEGMMLPPMLDPKARGSLTVEELVVADWLRDLGGKAYVKATVLESFERAVEKEKKAELE